jgi:predicted amidophosphoribosyltransferase
MPLFRRPPPAQRRQRAIGRDDPRRPTALRQGLERWEVDALFDRQQGLCQACGRALNRATMVVDHCHECALTHGHEPSVGCRRCFRGLAHPRCNAAMGWLGDTAASLRRVAVYAAHGVH